MFILTNYSDFNPQLIKKKTGLKINDQYSFIPLKYQNSSFIIQTPKLLMPFGVSNFKDRQYLSLSFINIDNDPQVQKFLTFFKIFNKHIIKIQKDLKNKKFIDPINTNKNFPPLINLKILPINNSHQLTQVYNSNHDKISIDSLVKNNYLKCIVYIPHLWFSLDNYGYDIYILQIKSYQLVNCLSNYAFIDDDKLNEESKINNECHNYKNSNYNNRDNSNDKKNSEPQIKIKDHPLYSKYFKMLSYGVNIEQIKFKMEIENLDSSLITKGSEFLIDPPKKVLLENNEKDNNSILDSKLSLPKPDLNQNLKSLFNSGFNLKKTQPLVPKNIVKDVSKYSINLNISLNDILNKINNLKKTNLLPSY